MTWIQTLNGKKFDLLNPDPAAICPHELATILGRTCRFGGHCEPEYSVAQHSVHVSHLVANDRRRLAALLHDAHEAYWGFGDICRPAKNLDSAVKRFLDEHAARIDFAVGHRFGVAFHEFIDPEIKEADNIALATEKRDLMLPEPESWGPLPPPDQRIIVPLDRIDAAELFLQRLDELTNGIQ